MAGFGFSEVQEMFRREVRRFVEAELLPIAKELNKAESVRRDLAKRLAEVVLLGITVPQEFGGQGSDWVSWGIVCRKIRQGKPFCRSHCPYWEPGSILARIR